jgi:hypothetical protein
MGEFTDDALPVRVARTAEKAPDMEDEAARFGISEEVHNIFFERSANEPTAGLTPRIVMDANDSTILKS